MSRLGMRLMSLIISLDVTLVDVAYIWMWV